jgi:hypothetical protein
VGEGESGSSEDERVSLEEGMTRTTGTTGTSGREDGGSSELKGGIGRMKKEGATGRVGDGGSGTPECLVLK